MHLVVIAWYTKVKLEKLIAICPREGPWWPQVSAMDPGRKLPSQLDGANWGLLDHASHGPQLAPSNYYMYLEFAMEKQSS